MNLKGFSMTSSRFARAPRSLIIVGGIVSVLACTGCNSAGEGALSGGAIGALGGLAIGSLTGSAGAGAAIGAVSGAIVGGVIGDQNHRAQQQQQQTRFYNTSSSPYPNY
jgi:outer membrane lipoprotein SlyB